MHVWYLGCGYGSQVSSQCIDNRLSLDLSFMPTWFDTLRIRFRDFWTWRIEWKGQIFRTTYIRYMVHVIENIGENRRKLSEIPPASYAWRQTWVNKPGFQERPYPFPKTTGCQLSRGEVRFSTRHITKTRCRASEKHSNALKYPRLSPNPTSFTWIAPISTANNSLVSQGK